MDAQKTVSRMIGVTQLLKHKRGGKEQAQLIQQLTARRAAWTPRSATCRTSIARDRATMRSSDGTPTSNPDPPSSRNPASRRSTTSGSRRSRSPCRSTDSEPGASSRRCFAARATARRPARRSPCACCAQQAREIVVEEPEAALEAALSPMVRRPPSRASAKVADREGGGTSFQVFLPATDRPAPPWSRRTRTTRPRRTRRRARTRPRRSEPLGQGRAGARPRAPSARRASSPAYTRRRTSASPWPPPPQIAAPPRSTRRRISSAR